MADHLKKRSTDDLDWTLASRTSLPCTTSLAKWCAEQRSQQEHKSFLLLLHDDDHPNSINQIYFAVHIRSQQDIQSLAKTSEDLGLSTTQYTHSDHATLVFSSAKIQPTEQQALSSLISDIFSLFLITGRPLRHYDCTFFLPLDLYIDQEIDTDTDYKEIPALKIRKNPKIERYKIKRCQSLLDRDDQYALNLVSATSVDHIPSTGCALVIVANISSSLHIRIFDADGKKIADKTEGELSKEQDFISLKKTLDPFPEISSLSAENKRKIIQEATSSAIDALSDDEAQLQAYEFFFTHLQNQLFETENNEDCPDGHSQITPITHWRIKHKQLADWKIQLLDPAGDGNSKNDITTSIEVRDISLYQYYNRMFLLAVRVAFDTDNIKALTAEGEDWWRQLVYADDITWATIQAKEVNRWLRFTKITRVLFAAFWQQKKEKKISTIKLIQGDKIAAEMQPRTHFSEVICHLLKEFLPLEDSQLMRTSRLAQVADERMFVHVSYALSGPAPQGNPTATAQFERLFSYALYVDERSDGNPSPSQWAYDQRYTRSLMQNQMLSRWSDINSLSGFTDYSSVFMGFGGYFSNVVSPEHVPYSYAKLQVAVLVYRTTLNYFDRRITSATQDLLLQKHHSAAFRELRRDFITFTNHYWFRQLSPQVQGNEISNRMMAQQQLEEKYELVKDEMERADEYSATLREQWFMNRADIAGKIGATIALAALLLTVLDTCSFTVKLIIFCVALLLCALTAFYKPALISYKNNKKIN